MSAGRGAGKGRRRSFGAFLETAEPEYDPGRLAAPKTKRRSSYKPTITDPGSEVQAKVFKHIHIYFQLCKDEYYASFFLCILSVFVDRQHFRNLFIFC